MIPSRYGGMGQRASCEFCPGHRGRGMICDLKVPAGGKGGDGNEFEIAQKMTLSDIYNTLKYPRDLVLGVIMK